MSFPKRSENRTFKGFSDDFTRNCIIFLGIIKQFYSKNLAIYSFYALSLKQQSRGNKSKLQELFLKAKLQNELERGKLLKLETAEKEQSSSYEKVVFMKGSQIGGTEAGNNWGGYIIDQAAGQMLVVQPTVEMGKRWSKGRLAPLIEDTDCLRGKVKDPRSRIRGILFSRKNFQEVLL